MEIKPPKPSWKLLRQIAGVILVILGFLALVTPLTPGAWLIVVGGQLLGIELLSHERLKLYYHKALGWWQWRRVEKKLEQLEEQNEEKTGS